MIKKMRRMSIKYARWVAGTALKDWAERNKILWLRGVGYRIRGNWT